MSTFKFDKDIERKVNRFRTIFETIGRTLARETRKYTTAILKSYGCVNFYTRFQSLDKKFTQQR